MQKTFLTAIALLAISGLVPSLGTYAISFFSVSDLAGNNIQTFHLLLQSLSIVFDCSYYTSLIGGEHDLFFYSFALLSNYEEAMWHKLRAAEVCPSIS